MAHGPVFTWSSLVVGLAALGGGPMAIFGERQRPVIGALWVVLGLLNVWGAWRHRALLRGKQPRA